MDKLNLKFLTVRILELDSACYGGCPLLDTSNVRIAYLGRTRPWITLTLSSDALSVSAFIVLSENNLHFSKGRRQNSGPFIQIWSPLGSSLIVTNERAFLTVGMLECYLNVENAPNPAQKHFEKTNLIMTWYYTESMFVGLNNIY